jgi:alpha-beta hydrolase superfamily lysophospholipase
VSDEPRSPLELLDALAVEEVEITPGLAHLEVYTLHGLLSALWHGPRDAPDVVLTMGGGMGSMLGPADALYHDLGTRLAAERGIGTIRVGYRKPNDLSRCVHDIAALADLASRTGARNFVTIGHSFGGAVAIQAGVVLAQHCRGVVTLATQSAGCEQASELKAPLLLFHGTDDEILPVETSEVVQMLAGRGEVVMLPGNGHLLTQAADELRERLLDWIPARFA